MSLVSNMPSLGGGGQGVSFSLDSLIAEQF